MEFFKILIRVKGDPHKTDSRGIPKRYKGAYTKLFNLLNKDNIFGEIYAENEAYNTSRGVRGDAEHWLGDSFVVPLLEEPSDDVLQAILKMRNVSIHPDTVKEFGLPRAFLEGKGKTYHDSKYMKGYDSDWDVENLYT